MADGEDLSWQARVKERDFAFARGRARSAKERRASMAG